MATKFTPKGDTTRVTVSVQTIDDLIEIDESGYETDDELVIGVLSQHPDLTIAGAAEKAPSSKAKGD